MKNDLDLRLLLVFAVACAVACGDESSAPRGAAAAPGSDLTTTAPATNGDAARTDSAPIATAPTPNPSAGAAPGAQDVSALDAQSDDPAAATDFGQTNGPALTPGAEQTAANPGVGATPPGHVPADPVDELIQVGIDDAPDAEPVEDQRPSGDAGTALDDGDGAIRAEDDGAANGNDPKLGDVHLSDWPDGAAAAQVGRKLAELFAAQPSDGTKHYKEACAWYGALSVASLLDDDALVSRLTSRFAQFSGTFDALLAGQGHVDENVFGIVPLEISLHDPDPSYLEQGLSLADHQQANIEVQTRYAIDDMFMITGLQMQAFRATGEPKYRDLAAATMVSYLDRLQQPDGTFYHHEDVYIKWGRGNGWVASGLTELMRELEQAHEHYPAIQQGFQAMMAGLLEYQIQSGEGAGLWKQVLDDEGGNNWAETSGSAMFTYAMVSGVKKGWLDEDTYGPVARAAWLGLVGHLEPNGELRDVSDWMWDGSVADYVARARVTGDNHGQAPMLWTAAALLR
jgi:rhamnogalacturonyl hydrolase YesR